MEATAVTSAAKQSTKRHNFFSTKTKIYGKKHLKNPVEDGRI